MKSDTFKALMKKLPILLLLYMAAGAFCRWYQLENELLLMAVWHRELICRPFY